MTVDIFWRLVACAVVVGGVVYALLAPVNLPLVYYLMLAAMLVLAAT